jgi:hypothetical protein
MCTVAPNPLGGLQSIACPAAPDTASLRGRLWATTRHAVLCGPRVSSLRKSLTDLPVQQGSPVPNARAHVSMVPDVRAIMGL